MKKKSHKILIATIACALGASALGVGIRQGEKNMNRQLINQENQFVVVEVSEDEIKINDPLLEIQMKELGVFIPPSERHKYNDKETITLDDPDFLRAFEEHYIPSNLRGEVYTWQNG